VEIFWEERSFLLILRRFLSQGFLQRAKSLLFDSCGFPKNA